MKRYGRLAAAFGAAALLLAGCGQTVPDKIEESTLVISAKGKVTAYMVGEFDKSYYNLTELEAMAREEAARFSGSAKGDAPVKVEGVSAAEDGGSRIVVTYSFDSTDSYRQFMQGDEELFFGTAAEAALQGYGGVTLYDPGDGSELPWTEAVGESGRHIVVYRPDLAGQSGAGAGEDGMRPKETSRRIYCPAPVRLVSRGAAVNPDGSVEMTWTAENAQEPLYILLKK